MAPIWIRKHREMIPSVFVLVLRLGEVNKSTTVGDGVGIPLDPTAIEDFERMKDAECVREILDRKRSTLERGIKLAVVLLCSREVLDNPNLDLRLSLIRRQSGLDSRASLFIISPVSNEEVSNFVLSLRTELFPASLDYYKEHGRRVRRKRSRQSSSSTPKGKLSEKGWNVRYDYKLGMFSEMRGEVEISLKHYEDCYETLVEMFSITTLLTPRTKRWAEAKVLADCLTVKISKMYLYLNEPSRAVAQLNRHTSRFRELSNTWGIGEQTFEFWSWLSKQYRLFADLTVIASQAGFLLPSLIPPPSIPLLANNSRTPIPTTISNQNSPGLIPSNVLQHSGYYFYLSGLCAVMRRDKFRLIKAGLGSDLNVPVSAAVGHEMKIDHGELIIDLFTKAYEYFKANKTSRMTLFIASQIALAHFEAGNHEMALKFHERIARTYRRENYRNVLDSIIELCFISALHLENFDLAIKSCFELLAPDSKISLDDREHYAERLLNILKNSKPASPEKSIVSVDTTEMSPPFQCQINFWKTTSNMNHSTPFQLSLATSPNSRTSSITFSTLEIHFNEVGRLPIVVQNDDSLVKEEKGKGVEFYSLDHEEKKVNLNWLNGTTKVFSGNINVAIELNLTVSKIVLVIREGDWVVKLQLVPDVSTKYKSVWYSSVSPFNTIPLHQSSPSVCQITPRKLQYEFELNHASPAYIDEEYEIHLDISNTDSVEMEISVDVILHSSPNEPSNQILVDELSSNSILKNILVGKISPNSSIRKTIRLLSLSIPGERTLDFILRSQSTLPDASISNITELNRSLIVSAIKPLQAQFQTRFHKKRNNVKALLDLTELNGWEGASDVELVAKVCAMGPWPLEIVGVKLVCDQIPTVRETSSSLSKEDLPVVWQTDDLYNIIYQLDVLPAPSLLQPTLNEGIYLEISWKRSSPTNTTSTISKTILPLPPIYSVPLSPTVTLSLPPTMILHQPTTLIYKLSNPTRRLLNLSISIDSSEGFVFSGSRKFQNFILSPGEWRFEKIIVVPLVVGDWRIPRMRVFEIERDIGREVVVQQGGEVKEEGIRMKEIQVTEGTDLVQIRDSKQILLERELRKARGEREDDEAVEEIKEFRTLILPA